MRLNVAPGKKGGKTKGRKKKEAMRREEAKWSFNQAICQAVLQSVSQSVTPSHSDSVEQSTLQRQRQSLLISLNQISAAVRLLAACCQSLPQTQQLILRCTAVTADTETRKEGRPTPTVRSSSIKHWCFAFLAESSRCEGHMKVAQ